MPNAVYASGALDEPDNGPGEIEVDDDGAILEVLPLAENVRRDQDAQLVGWFDFVALFVADRAEPPGERRRIVGIPGDVAYGGDFSFLKLRRQVGGGVRELGEHQHLIAWVDLSDKPIQGKEFGVSIRVPVGTDLEDSEQFFRIASQSLNERIGREQRRCQPIEALFQCRRVFAVNQGGALAEILFGAQGVGFDLGVLRFADERLVAGGGAVIIGIARVENFGVLRADWNGEAVFKGMEEDVIPKNVAFHGEKEGVSAAFEPLKQIGAAEAHQAAAGAGQVLQGARLGLRGR